MSNIKINKDIVDFESMSLTDRMNYRAHLAAMMDTIDRINKERDSETWCNYSNMPSPKAYEQKTNHEWVDRDNDEYDSSSDGEDRRGGVDFDDSNEY